MILWQRDAIMNAEESLKHYQNQKKMKPYSSLKEAIGVSSQFPAYMYSSELLQRCTWNEYRTLLLFHKLTLGFHRWQSKPFTMKHIEEVGLSRRTFNTAVKGLIEKLFITQVSVKDLTTEPIYHLQDLGYTSKKKRKTSVKRWRATFLAPQFGRAPQDVFKFWYVGDGREQRGIWIKYHLNVTPQFIFFHDATKRKEITLTSIKNNFSIFPDPREPTKLTFTMQKNLNFKDHFYFFYIRYL